MTPPSGGSITSDLTVSASQLAQAGTFPFEVLGSNGALSHNYPMTLNVSFNVIPESPIGTLAMVAASIGALGGFVYFRQYKNRSAA